MADFVPILIVLLIGAALGMFASQGFSTRERRFVWFAFVVHAVFALSQVPITQVFYGRSDVDLYFTYGEILARLMQAQPSQMIPEVTALLLHNESQIPFTIIGNGHSTGSMSAISAYIFYVLGPSKYACCLVIAVFSFLGKIAIYRVLRSNLEEQLRPMLAVAALLVPSYVYWTSGLIKEGIAIGGLGWMVLGIDRWVRTKRPKLGIPIIALGAVPVALIKPYIMFIVVIAGASWYYLQRASDGQRMRIRPGYVAFGAALGIGGIVVLGNYFPQFALESLSASTAELQQLGRGIRGGSNFELGSSVPRTVIGQIAYMPAALATALFRPSIFEARNILMLANALETTIITVLFLKILFSTSFRQIKARFVSEPFLVFCLVFVVGFGVAVGLASSNLGTLSRYRSPLVPFFVALLVVLSARRSQAVATPKPTDQHKLRVAT